MRFFKVILVSGFLWATLPPHIAQAGLTSRLLDRVNDYFKRVKKTKGAALIVKNAPPKTDEFLYGHAFTKIVPPRPGKLGQVQKAYTFFPQLIAQSLIRKKNYKFTPIHSLAEDVLGLGVLDGPVQRLTAQKPKRLTVLAKMGLSMPVFLWFYKNSDPEAIKKRKQQENLQQHRNTLWHFVQHDFRGQALKQMHDEGLITQQESLEYAMHYMEALKHYYTQLDTTPSLPPIEHSLIEWAQNPLFADTYAVLLQKNYIQFENHQTDKVGFEKEASDSAAPTESSVDPVHWPAPGQGLKPVCRKDRKKEVEKIFQLTHLALYQHRFLDAWLFDTKDKLQLQNLQNPEHQWYTLLEDFRTDTYVKALFEAHEQKALNKNELKYLLHQDVQDQFLWRTAKVFNHSMTTSLDDLRQEILNDIYARHRLLN